MKIISLILILLLSYSFSIAQSSTFTFGYDDAGNRIIREIGPSQFHQNEPDENEVYNDYLAVHRINIFPYPLIA